MPIATETRIEDGDAARRRRRRDKLSSLGLAAAACLVGLLVAELGLRLMGFKYVNFFYPDSVLGWVLRAGAQGTQTQEGSASVRINRYGFRDHEWEVEKPATHFRVAVLGDSFTAAIQVPEEQRFTSILESGLRSCDALAGRRPEVLNFGVGRWGTAQALLCLRDRVWQFDPDMVVLAFFHGNDLVDNSKDLENGNQLDDEGSARTAREGSPNFRPYFSLRDGTLVLDDSFRNDPGFRRETTWWMRTFRSAVFSLRTAQLLARAIDARSEASPRSREERAAAATELAERGLALEVYAEPSTPAWDEAWRVTEALLIEMAAEARGHGSPFSMLLVTSSSQVLPGEAQKARAMGLDLFYPNRRLVELGRRHGFPVLSLAEPFLARAEADGSRFHGFHAKSRGGHWNALGHRAAGELLATELCRQLVGTNQPAIASALPGPG